MQSEQLNTCTNIQQIEELLRMHGGDSFNMNSFADAVSRVSDNNPNVLKQFIQNPQNSMMTTYQKEALLKTINDPQYIESCIKGEIEGVELEPFSKARLYMNREFKSQEEKETFIDSFLENPIFELDDEATSYMLTEISNREKLKGYILNENIKLTPITKGDCISLLDHEDRMECISSMQPFNTKDEERDFCRRIFFVG